MKPNILSFFITKYNDPKPILFYPVNTPLNIEIHAMLDNLSLGKHHLKYTIKDGEQTLIGKFEQEIDLSNVHSESEASSVAEISIFSIADEDESFPQKFVTAELMLDDKVKTFTKVYMQEVN